MKKNLFRYIRYVLFSLILLTVASGFYNTFRSNPEGTDYVSVKYNINSDDIEFLYDLTYKDDKGNIISEQEIFDEIFLLIDKAKAYILLDMFLFNSYIGKADDPYRSITAELTSKLVEKKTSHPDIIIDFITDPVNTVYGGVKSKEISDLKDSGINVIVTDLTKLRDSTVLYSPFWRLFIQWFGNSNRGGAFPHPFSEKEKSISLRSYFTLLNFKANHRKVFFSDYNNNPVAIVTSANPHDGSSAHSNVAFKIQGEFARELYVAEKAVAKFSDAVLFEPDFIDVPFDKKSIDTGIQVQLVTESKIDDMLMHHLNIAEKGDNINIGVFYLCKRGIIKAILHAAKRGVNIRLILDPNKDAFGREKNGIPNRQAASELIKKSGGRIKIRWYNTHGEQYHSKFALFDYLNNFSVVILGSANYTRKNLNGYNLELDIVLSATSTEKTINEVREHFERIWNSENYTVDYSVYSDNSFSKRLIYLFLEYTGSATF